MGTAVVLALVALAAGLSARALYREKKRGGGCGGDCSRCSRCSGRSC